jgi:uncharacterized glyoxalase superfamily protein PhnB
MATRKKTTRPVGRKASKKASVKRRSAHRARPARKQPETLRLRSAAPSFTVANIEKSVAFYRDVLGFTVKDRWDQDGKLMGVELVAGNVRIMLSQDDWKKGRDRVKGEGFRIYCMTAQSVDAIAARIQASGGSLLQEPRDQPWGLRDFAVADPDGFKITISNEA